MSNIWIKTRDCDLSILKQIFTAHDPRPCAVQAQERYAHGGGWHPFDGFTLHDNGREATIDYPGDPPMRELARTEINGETVILFQHDWVAIIQPDGAHEIARMD